jgi:hypothetical protein
MRMRVTGRRPLAAGVLAITNSGSPNPDLSGQQLTCTITATNTGGQTATGVTVTYSAAGNYALWHALI